MAHLRFENVHKIYVGPEGGVHALRGVSFDIERGDFVAVWGPSGCGKSTLLHLAGAMDSPTSGQVWLACRQLDQMTHRERTVWRRRHVGFVFQQFFLLPTLNVLENVALPLLLDGKDRRLAEKRARALLELIDLEDRRAHYPSQLSGGEMQRVAVARAVVNEPELLIADEPTGSLDSHHGRQVLDLLARLNGQRQLTILLATHSQEAASYARRTFRMRDGQIETIDVGEHSPCI